MRRTMIAIYREPLAAHAVVEDLASAGVPRDDIHLITEDAARRYRELSTWTDRRREQSVGVGAWTGLLVGALVGAGLGLLLALTTGWTLGPTPASSAAAFGGIVAVLGLILGGVSALAWSRDRVPQALNAAEPLPGRCALVAVEVEDRDVKRALEALSRHDPVDLDRAARELPRTGPVHRPDDLPAKDWDAIADLGLHDPV